MTDTPTHAGLIVYRQRPEGWDGLWSHTQTGGALAKELVSGASIDSIPGTWPVEIWGPDGSSLFTGDLNVSALGEVLAFRWVGHMKNGDAATYQGIGQRIDGVTLAATFEQV